MNGLIFGGKPYYLGLEKLKVSIGEEGLSLTFATSWKDTNCPLYHVLDTVLECSEKCLRIHLLINQRKAWWVFASTLARIAVLLNNEMNQGWTVFYDKLWMKIKARNILETFWPYQDDLNASFLIKIYGPNSLVVCRSKRNMMKCQSRSSFAWENGPSW